VSGALPTYLIIGAAKCGTTSLHHYLGEHPEIQVARRKELSFFVDEPTPDAESTGRRQRPRGEWRRGVDWYRSWFSEDFAVRGEATPGYMSSRFEGTAERIHAVVPGVKLIVCVRDPVARAVSQYRQSREDWYESRPVEEALHPGSGYVRSSCYAARLDDYLEHWTMEDIHIVAQDDLLQRRRETLAGVFEFLGVDAGYWSSTYDRALNVGARKRGPAWSTLQMLRRRPWWHHVAERVPSALVPRIDALTSGSPGPVDTPPDEVLQRIADAVRDDAERFRALTGRSFSNWSV
jgi:hypothetical protein